MGPAWMAATTRRVPPQAHARTSQAKTRFRRSAQSIHRFLGQSIGCCGLGTVSTTSGRQWWAAANTP